MLWVHTCIKIAFYSAIRPLSSHLNYNSAREKPVPLKQGDSAPDFELPAIAGEERITVRSRDYLGKQNLVVTFHPLDWTPT
jgi:hypothetical protein